MARPVLRITPRDIALESEIIKVDNRAIVKWVKLSKDDLEYKVRHSKGEETAVLQGALRVLDDLEEIING